MSIRRQSLWRGSREITLSPESPEWDLATAEDQITLVYEGPYEALLAHPPPRGGAIAGYEGFTVDRVRIKRSRSTKGTMTVFASRGGTGGESVERPQYEVDWTEQQLPLMQAPAFQAGGKYELSDDDRMQIVRWEMEEDLGYKTIYAYRTEQGYTMLSDHAKEYARRILRGQTSYTEYVPVLQRTRLSLQNVSHLPAGRRETPPSDFGELPRMAGGRPYVWVKTSARSLRTGRGGRWQIIEQWHGFESVDKVIYP